MKEELESIEKKKTLELVNFPQGKKAYRCEMGVQGQNKSQRRDYEAQS